MPSFTSTRNPCIATVTSVFPTELLCESKGLFLDVILTLGVYFLLYLLPSLSLSLLGSIQTTHKLICRLLLLLLVGNLKMVWEQGSQTIVMLTRLMKSGSSLCHRYWPEEGSQVYASFEVHLVSEHIWCEDYLVRSLLLKNRTTGETRTITQFHFLSWPENSVPSSAKAILDFRRWVSQAVDHLLPFLSFLCLKIVPDLLSPWFRFFYVLCCCLFSSFFLFFFSSLVLIVFFVFSCLESCLVCLVFPLTKFSGLVFQCFPCHSF